MDVIPLFHLTYYLINLNNFNFLGFALTIELTVMGEWSARGTLLLLQYNGIEVTKEIPVYSLKIIHFQDNSKHPKPCIKYRIINGLLCISWK